MTLHLLKKQAMLWLLLQTATALAQTKTVEPSDSAVYILETVVVYGERWTPTSSLVELDEKTIQSLNAATVADVLRSATGLSVTSGPKSETETRIRGFAASNVLVLVDGRPINPGYYGKVDLSMLSIENVAKITVVRGPGEAAYGANSMGGVISIITKNGTESPRATVKGEFGDRRYRKISVSHGLRVDRYSYWFSAYEHHSEGFRLSSHFGPTTLEDGSWREHSSFHKIGADGKLEFEVSPRFVTGLSVGYHWAEKDIAPTIYAWDSPSYREFPEWRRGHITVSNFWKVRHNIDVKSSLFADSYRDRFINYLSPEQSAQTIDYDSRLQNWTTGVDIDARISVRTAHSLTGAVQLKRDLMKKQPDLDEPWFSRRTITSSESLQWDWRISNRTSFSLGTGLHHFVPQQSQYRSSFFSPLLSIRQVLPFRLVSHLSYARALRFPTIHELYSESSGNENLRPQYADKYEVGLERWITTGKGQSLLKFALTAFYNDLSDLIYREARSYRFRNIGAANLYGWEIEGQLDLNHVLRASLGFAHLQSSKSASEVMAMNPKNAVQLQLSIAASSAIEMNYEFKCTGRRSTRFPEMNLNSYSLHNLNLSYWMGKAIGVRLELSNLSDRDYQEELGYPAPGRQFVFEITSRLWTEPDAAKARK